jgi:glycosyltransferase 2 family protein
MKRFRLLLPAAGLLLLGYLAGSLGLEAVLDNLVLMKWSFPAILLLAGMWHITNTIAWSFAFPPGAFRPRLRRLFMAKLAGDAVNQMTPLANLGGEPLKAYLLKDQSPTSRGLASVVINKTAQIITGLGFTTLGLGAVILQWNVAYDLPLPIKVGMGALLSASALLVYILYRKQGRMFSALKNLLTHVGIKTDALETRIASAVRVDEGISYFYHQHPLRFLAVLSFHALGWLLGACETYLILNTLTPGIDFDVAFLITSLTVIINSLFFFMPSNIGVFEGGQVFLVASLGLDPALGFSLGFLKRMRKLFWIAIGWFFLTHLSRKTGASGGATMPLERPNLRQAK